MARIKNMNTLGDTGVSNYAGGYLVSNETNAKLASASNKYKYYQDILFNSTITAASVRYFLNLLSKANWSVTPASDKPKDKEYAEFVESVLHDMNQPFHRIVRKAAMYKFHGFSILEWTAKRNKDGTIGFKCIENRPQHTIERWDLDKYGRLKGIYQTTQALFKSVYIPIDKVLYLVDDALTDSPDGVGVLRHILPTAMKLKRLEQLELYGFETDMRGIPVGIAPLTELDNLKKSNQIDEAGVTTTLAPMKSFLQNHIKGPNNGLLLDSDVYKDSGTDKTPTTNRKWGVELLSSVVKGQDAIGVAIHRLNSEIARIIGTEQLLLGSNDKGSFALSRDKTLAFFLVVDSTLRDMAEVFNDDIIDNLWLLNGYPEKSKPRFTPESIQYKNIEEIALALKNLAVAGVRVDNNDEAITEIFNLMGLEPPIRTEEEILAIRQANLKPSTSLSNTASDVLTDNAAGGTLDERGTVGENG